MKKGISPIVAVVLLIAIAVIAAVGLYFWVGGLATKQPTPTTPIVITAQRVSCNTTDAGNLTALVQNLDPSTTLYVSLYVTADDGTTVENGTVVNIAPSEQGQVEFGITADEVGNFVSGSTYTIYGATGVGQATVVC
ncbi:archaellin/type IV pilin N-terminal domain-containing protein [archaeon]